MIVLLISDNPLIKTHFLDFSQKYSDIVPLQSDDTQNGIEIWIKKRPHLTIFDVVLPKNDPLSFVLSLSRQEEIKHSSRYFLFLSTLEPNEISHTKKALQEVGSGDFLVKGIEDEPNAEKDIEDFSHSIEHLYEILQRKFSTSPTPYLKTPKIPENLVNRTDIVMEKILSRPIELIAIGISTGGPFVLRKLFSEIHSISVPIIIVQHMPAGFIEGFVEDLKKIFPLPFRLAKQGETLEKKVYFAPDYSHLRIGKIQGQLSVLLDHSGPIKGFLPSIEATFESLGTEKIPCLGILMSGLGDDGVDNLSILHAMGNPVVTQIQEDTVAYGMPSSLINKGAVDGILSIALIGKVIEAVGKTHR